MLFSIELTHNTSSLGMAVDREGAEKLRDGLQQKLIWATNKLMQDPDCEGKKESFI